VLDFLSCIGQCNQRSIHPFSRDAERSASRKPFLHCDATLQKVRDAGFSDKALLETIGVIGVYTTLQYIRHVADPDQDFPIVPEFNPDTHAAPTQALTREENT